MAYSLSINLDSIRQGRRTFDSTEGRARNPSRRPPAADAGEEIGTHEAGEITEQLMPGVIRDERGAWIAPETED